MNRVRAAWNGQTVLQYFDVSGPEVGRLVRVGQDYVSQQLSGGAEEVSAGQIRDWIRHQATPECWASGARRTRRDDSWV
jgi:hypothetical protein